jgi:multidrug efflux pump subunit AcrA (membrane-fusion protein)
VKIYTERHQDVLVIPEKALMVDDNDTTVFVIEGDRAKRRSVEVGLISERKAEIRSGVSEGEHIVVEGNYGLTDGAQIKW